MTTSKAAIAAAAKCVKGWRKPDGVPYITRINHHGYPYVDEVAAEE